MAPSNPDAAIRVLVVDDHDLLRFALKLALNTADHIEVVGEAADGQQAIELAQSLLPDLILMDLVMPRVNGVEATTAIHQLHPQIRILVLTSGTEPELIDQALQAGAQDYLLKTIPVDQLTMTIDRLFGGDHSKGFSL